MLGVPSAAMQEMLLDPSAVNHTDHINLIVPTEVPHNVLVANCITLKLDGLIYFPNKRRLREARRLRKVLRRRQRIIDYFLNRPQIGEE